MALTQQLLHILDNEDEPLPKRLRIADNAFKTVTLPIQNREFILFNWISSIAKKNDDDAWHQLLSWLTSQPTQELCRNDVTLNDLQHLVKVVTNGLLVQSQSTRNVAISCAIALIENRTFQLFFKHDLENYCVFVSQIMNQIDDPNILNKFVTNEQIFNRYLITSDDFSKYFIKNILISLGNILDKFPERKETFLQLSSIVERCLFHRNFKVFSNYFQMLYEDVKLGANSPKLPKILMKSLSDLFKNDKSISQNIYKITFYSFCASYNNSFDHIYKFFILLIETLGFDVSTYFNLKRIKKFSNSTCSVDSSVSILVELCQVLTEFNKELSSKVNEISFTEFLKNITISVVSITNEPNERVYKFLNYCIIIDPLITEDILNDLLVYVMPSNKGNTKIEYETFLIAVFEVFSKLHRIPNLISKMIPTLKSALENNFQGSSNKIGFNGSSEHRDDVKHNFTDIMPPKVLSYFLQCVTSFASWQVINLFKTLLFHFENAVNDLSSACEDSSKFVYVEIISSLIAQFLCSVRIAEHTSTAGAVEKFVKHMEELKKVLKLFGTTLVKMEHNPVLMRSCLNICYSWGELYVTLAYYSVNNEVVLPKTLDADSTACNITYVHSYLTKDQWRLISQRITNFGETPCKQIMNKLYLQKLKAMMLFENVVNEEVSTSIKLGILSSLDDNWRDLICDQVFLSQILTDTNCSSIAENLLHDATKTRNLSQLNLISDNQNLVSMVLYTCISKINKIFKRKYKSSQMGVKLSLVSKMYSHITKDLFFNVNDNGLVLLRDTFVKGVSEEYKEVVSQFSDTDLSLYMDVIKSIPIIQYNNPTIQEVLILFLISVVLELQRNALENEQLLQHCESIIIGIAQNYSGSFKVLIEPFTTVQIIIRNFKRYIDLFTHILNNVMKSEENFASLNKGIDVITQNIKQEENLQCALLILKYINKHKKLKISVENKELLMQFQETIFDSILKLIKKEKKSPDLTEAYALLFKHRLTKDTQEAISELLPFLMKYVDGICTNTKNTRGSLLLLTTILRNKGKIKTMNEDISLKAWTYCQNLLIEDKKEDEFAELVVLIIEHVPNEQFLNISNDLLKYAIQAINDENSQKFIEELRIWNIVLSCNLNPVKTNQWQKQLESLLLQHVLPYLTSNNQKNQEIVYEHIVKLEINIIQHAQLPLTSLLIDALFLTISTITSYQTHVLQNTFLPSINILQMLLKFRKTQMMDYLPAYLQRYRSLLKILCIKSNTSMKFELGEEQQISDCAHRLEKLTNHLVLCNKHLMRIAPYLIADILKQYEEITLLPNVKLHLNNCLYSLISLCDDHAISYLMRILSTASTEMFKVIYENFKKYYKFTGRV